MHPLQGGDLASLRRAVDSAKLNAGRAETNGDTKNLARAVQGLAEALNMLINKLQMLGSLRDR